jgi:hypothetical protein
MQDTSANEITRGAAVRAVLGVAMVCFGVE